VLSTAWIRVAVAEYSCRKSVLAFPSPHDGLYTVPPMVARRGSFFRSYPTTSGSPANARATVSQPLANRAGGQLPFHHSPFPSESEQHHPWCSRWQFGMTMSPARVSARTHA